MFAAKKASIERGGHRRAPIIANKTNKAQRQFALSASSTFYEPVYWFENRSVPSATWDAPSSISATRTSFSI